MQNRRLRVRLPGIVPERQNSLVFAIWLVALAYLALIALWFGLQSLEGDRWPWLFAINSLALYLFLPLPLVAVAALACRNLLLGAGFLGAGALFLALWGPLLMPGGPAPATGPTLTVMTYNLLGFNERTDGVIEAIRESNADVIGLVELNRDVADAIEAQLSSEYPYQDLDARQHTHGAGVISRYPFEATGDELPDVGWVGEPAIVRVDFPAQPFIFVRVHTPSGPGHVEAREEEAELLTDFAEQQSMPVVVAGDFNATERNRSYAIMTDRLEDAWREAGSGFGHTFPGASRSKTPGSSRPDLFGISVPQWLVRIDYVFHSEQWRAVDARIGPWDGYSDHRPVIAVLTPAGERG